jgi:Predicted membrane protein
MFVLFGKVLYSFIWLFLLFNLIHPYPRPANIVANIGLIVFVIIHGLQACILHSTMTSQEKEQDKFKVLRLFLFGVFESLSWKNRK